MQHFAITFSAEKNFRVSPNEHVVNTRADLWNILQDFVLVGLRLHSRAPAEGGRRGIFGVASG